MGTVGVRPMTKEDNYRQHSADLVRLAQRASASADKGRLIALAEAWLDLAGRCTGEAAPARAHPAHEGY